ncbi:hypothetical protein [Streptomyces sp. BBFR102]|uniref:hypothetical protein n=1 Tax=Streptomyces sp. BBFR102 TaxID=3448171 RepID=UPI003F53DB29
MPGNSVAPDGNAATARLVCRTCEEYRHGEAAANAERDWSRATDCRVLLRHHQDSADCVAPEPR